MVEKTTIDDDNHTAGSTDGSIDHDLFIPPTTEEESAAAVEIIKKENNKRAKQGASFNYDIDDDDKKCCLASAAMLMERNNSKKMTSTKNNMNSKKKISLSSVQKATYDDDVMIKDLNEWVGVTKENRSSVTGVLLCSMIERVAKDGAFSEKEEKSVMVSLSCQQSLFGYLIVMDCLFLSMFLPLLVEDTFFLDDDNHMSPTTWRVLKMLYDINVSFVFFSCCVHVMICGLFLGLSSYLMDAKSVLWMLMHCHGNFVFINSAMFPIFIGVILTGMLSCVLRLGVLHAIPAIVFATLAIVSSVYYFNKIIRPLFLLLSTTGDGTWIANEEVDDTLGRNAKKVLQKLAKTNKVNNTRSSMINMFDIIDSDRNRDGVSLDELQSNLGKTSIMLTEFEMKTLFRSADKDGDGVISRTEWEKLVDNL